MAGFNPAGNLPLEPANYFPDSYWDRFFATRDWLRDVADDATYWDYWTMCDGFPVPKRKKDSWLDRLKHRNTRLGRVAQRLSFT